MNSKVRLTKEQKEVLSDVLDWLKGSSEQYLTVGGYAGTGKTLLIAKLRKILLKLNPKIKVAFCAYTGKASRVLVNYLKVNGMLNKGDSVSTIHSLIYAPIMDDKGNIAGWKRKASLEADLIIVDEASMVDELLWQDMMAFGLPILAIGDHGQLPPVGGSFNLMETPNLRLETIHRQEADNPIINLSMMARKHGDIPLGTYGSRVRKINRYDSASGQEVEEMMQRFSDDLLILVGFNHSRVRLNQQIRQYLDIQGENPRSGDRLICLKNNWRKGIYNGMIGYLKRIIPITNMKAYEVEVDFPEDDHYYTGLIHQDQFNSTVKFEDLGKMANKMDLFDYGYALTVHKAQGGQAREVLLFEERSRHMDDDQWRRWLYTGITRAEEYLTIVGY